MSTSEYTMDYEDHLEQSKVQQSRLKGALSFRSKDIGNYTVGRTLGKGSCAVVKLGIHRDTGKQVAIKIMKPRSLREQKEALREVEALNRLSHPNITRLHQVIREEGYTCLILELGVGGELFERVMDCGKIPEGEARVLFRQILSGVQYMHANLVAHRDLKPENLLLDEYGNIKISDFGLSNIIKPGKLFSTWCGSPVYTPPEVVLRQQYNGIAMDIWSLGVILYVMVTGGMPWRLESNVVKNIDDLIEGNYDIPDFLNVSKDCKELIGMMLVADGTKRASLEQLMNHKWTCAGFEGAPASFIEPKPLVNVINENAFAQLEGLGYDLEVARKQIQTVPTSPALTAYYHLLAKHRRLQKVNSCSPEDAKLVNSPDQYLNTISRTRSKSHPTPKSPLATRKISLSSLDTKIDISLDEEKPSSKKKEKSILRTLLDRFRKPSAKRNSREVPRPVSMVVAHNSPSPPSRRRY